MINDNDIVKWLFKAKNENNPDLYILENFYNSVKQFIDNPNSLATKEILSIAMICTKTYLAVK